MEACIAMHVMQSGPAYPEVCWTSKNSERVRKKAKKAPKKIQKIETIVVMKGPTRRGEVKKARPR
jgi:hypothetical protein